MGSYFSSATSEETVTLGIASGFQGYYYGFPGYDFYQKIWIAGEEDEPKYAYHYKVNSVSFHHQNDLLCDPGNGVIYLTITRKLFNEIKNGRNFAIRCYYKVYSRDEIEYLRSADIICMDGLEMPMNKGDIPCIDIEDSPHIKKEEIRLDSEIIKNDYENDENSKVFEEGFDHKGIVDGEEYYCVTDTYFPDHSEYNRGKLENHRNGATCYYFDFGKMIREQLDSGPSESTLEIRKRLQGMAETSEVGERLNAMNSLIHEIYQTGDGVFENISEDVKFILEENGIKF